MSFVQIIEFRTTDIEAAQQVHSKWREDTEGRRTARRELITRDRHDPDRYFALVFFDSYESAMENSGLPETKAAAEQYQKLSEGPPLFYDLDVLDEMG
jgi:hypothetical protein